MVKKKFKNYERYGQVFTSKKKAEKRRDLLNKSAKEGNLNLRHRVLKRRSRYILTTESLKKRK